MHTLWSGRAHPILAQQIAHHLGYPLCPTLIDPFPSGETRIPTLEKPLLHTSMILVQSLSPPINHHLMELLFMADAAHPMYDPLIAVIPYFAYARQDKLDCDKSKAPILKTVCDLLQMRSIAQVISVDVHSATLAECLSIPFMELHPTEIWAVDIEQKYRNSTDPLMLISPDLGSQTRVQRLSQRLKIPYRVLNKKQYCSTEYQGLEHYRCILVDDILDTGKTLCTIATALKKQGVRSICAYITHGLFSEDARQRCLDTAFEEIVITDTIAQPQAILACNKIRVLSIAPLVHSALTPRPSGGTLSR